MAFPAAAWDSQTISSSPVELFKAERIGGPNQNGVLGIAVVNQDLTYDVLVAVLGHTYTLAAGQADDAGNLPSGTSFGWVRVGAGKSATFEVAGMEPNSNAQIDAVWAKRASSDVVIGGGVVKRR